MRPLSERQRQVLDGLWRGETAKQIAARLQISTHTVDYYAQILRRRFGAANAVQLVRAALQAGELSL